MTPTRKKSPRTVSAWAASGSTAAHDAGEPFFVWFNTLCVPAQTIVAEFLATFKEFPPRQKSASFSLDQVLEKMKQSGSGGA